MKLREQQFGRIPWKGAWGGLGSMDKVPDTQPDLPKLAEGAPKTPAAAESAALFMICMVHEHPHQVTILEAGPMTNLALAIRLDPSFAATAKQLVFMGGLLDTNMMSITGNADFASDFNMIFDPEAAHITLTALWPSITVVGNISNDVMMTKDYMAKITKKTSPVTSYLSKYYSPCPCGMKWPQPSPQILLWCSSPSKPTWILISARVSTMATPMSGPRISLHAPCMCAK